MRHYLKKTMRPLLVLAVLLALPSVAFAQDTLTFIPLTSIPGIGDIAASGSLSGFLNTLYRICVGAAAVLAAVQIVRAGITQMTSDSVTLKKEARQMIQMALFGLLLVLSPTIVFGVIDPRILNLDIGADSLSFTPAQPRTEVPEGSVGNPLSTGDGITAGTRLSCLYPRQAPDAKVGLQGNLPVTVVEDESATEDRTIIDGNNLLRVQFDADPEVIRYVAAGDCREITNTQSSPTGSETQSLGDFRVGQFVYCDVGASPLGYRTGNIVSIQNGQYLEFSCTGCSRIFVSPDRCVRTLPTEVCGVPPECKTGCALGSDGAGEYICEPL